MPATSAGMTERVALKRNTSGALAGFRRLHRYGDLLELRAAGRKPHLEREGVVADEIGRRAIKCDIAGDFQRQALLVIGGLHLSVLDGDLAMGRRLDQADRRQRARGAIGQDIDIGADLNVLAGRPLDVALNDPLLGGGADHPCQDDGRTAQRPYWFHRDPPCAATPARFAAGRPADDPPEPCRRWSSAGPPPAWRHPAAARSRAGFPADG